MGDEQNEAFAHLYRTYFGDHHREREEIARLPALLAGVELFIDVGASLGQYTYFANQAMQDGRIISIEADPERFEELARNCAKWEGEGTNSITPIHAAVGDSRDPVRFYVTGTQISGGLFPVPERSDAYRPVEVPQVMLADFHEPGIKTLIKIDVEGGEYRVMHAAGAHLTDGNSRFLIEITRWGDRGQGHSVGDMLKFLRSCNLRIEKNARGHSTNYLLTPAAPGESIRDGYWRVSPLLLTKSAYERWVPYKVRLARERALNRWRRFRHRRGAGPTQDG